MGIGLRGAAFLIIALLALTCGITNAAQPRAQTRPATRRIQPLVIPQVSRDQIICFCLYTIHNNTLKLSAQLYPLRDNEPRTVTLEMMREGGQWQKAATAEVNPAGWCALLRVNNYDSSRPGRYRVSHPGGAAYEGTLRPDPTDKDSIVVGLFTGNSNTDRGPRADIIANLKAQDPDLLFFSGDQSYDHRQHLAAWLLFGRQFGEIIRDRPTITIPDDHDVGTPNLWGEAGRVAKRPDGSDGGYFMPPAYVNEVQRCQTQHLPDPYDPTPVHQGITVYYTSLNVGGIDFAIIEDRKWKSGPHGLVPQMGPRPDHINDPAYDRAAIDLPEAQLLGERQLKFLRAFGQDWTRAQMKVVLSQTIFAGGAHLHGQQNNRLLADLDSNGWPQHGRNTALREIRRFYGFMMGGDQHLATVIHHGVNEWEDAGWSFCCPSIVNFYGRWRSPLEKPLNHDDKNPLEHTGRYFDGFGNKITMHAYANPTANPDNHKAAGYGLVRFTKSTRAITMECWPRFVDVTKPDAKQFPGWPITIHQQDNYARAPIAHLPELIVKNAQNPVIQIIDEDTGDIVYTLRIQGNKLRPKVFKQGLYTIHLGEGEKRKSLTGIQSLNRADPAQLDVELSPAP